MTSSVGAQGQTLKGSLASHTTVTVSADEWHEAKERAWREAVRERFGPAPLPQ